MKTVIWDWNGTLLDDLDLVISVNNQMLKERELKSVSKEFYLEEFDFPVRDYYQKCGFDLKSEPFEDLAKEYMDLYMDSVLECKLHHGILEILESFKAAGIRQFILSAKQQDLLRATVPQYKIDHYFEEIAGIETVTAEGKISRGISLIEKHQIETTNCFFIGDTTHDYAVAKEFGLEALLLSKGHHSKNRLLKSSCSVLDSPRELSMFVMKQ